MVFNLYDNLNLNLNDPELEIELIEFAKKREIIDKINFHMCRLARLEMYRDILDTHEEFISGYMYENKETRRKKYHKLIRKITEI